MFFSAVLFPNGKAAKALNYCFLFHEVVIPSYVIYELNDVINRKCPYGLKDFKVFVKKVSSKVVFTPTNIKEGEFYIRDAKNYPILYSAIIEKVDLILTGDKDFKDIGIKYPKVVTPSKVLTFY